MFSDKKSFNMLESRKDVLAYSNLLSYEEASKYSYSNCHIEGMFSIVISLKPFVRMFILPSDVPLIWQPELVNSFNIRNLNLPVGYHMHRTQTKLVGNTGMIVNYLGLDENHFEDQPDLDFTTTYMNKYSFVSAVLDKSEDTCKFEAESAMTRFFLDTNPTYIVGKDRDISGKPNIRSVKVLDLRYIDYHTVSVPCPLYNQPTSWFVVEDEPNPLYKPYVYTTVGVTDLYNRSKNLYKPVTPEEVKKLLESVELYLNEPKKDRRLIF